MRLFEKNGYLFISEGYFLSTLSSNKLLTPKQRVAMINQYFQDTVGGENIGIQLYDTCAVIKNMRETYSFIKSSELTETLNKAGADKKLISRGVGSLGMYIVEVMELDASISNCIICFTVSAQECGYVLVKDGTIYPDGGEYISDKTSVKESIVSLIRKHNRGTNIERHIQAIYAPSELVDIQDLLISDLGGAVNVGISPDSSETLFWSKKILRKYFNRIRYKHQKSMLKPILIAVGMSIVAGCAGYFVFTTLYPDVEPITIVEAPKTNLAKGSELVKSCFNNSDAIFTISSYSPTQFGWYMDSFRCDLNGLEVKFRSVNQAPVPTLAIEELKKILKDNNVTFANGIYTFKKPIKLNTDYQYTGNALKLFESMGEYSANYGFDFKTLNQQAKTQEKIFEIDSDLSPVFLLNNKVLTDVPLSSIEGKYNLTNSSYSWKILGKIK